MSNILEVKNLFVIGIRTAQHRILQNDGLSLQWFSVEQDHQGCTDEFSRHIFEKTNAWNSTEEDGKKIATRILMKGRLTGIRWLETMPGQHPS